MDLRSLEKNGKYQLLLYHLSQLRLSDFEPVRIYLTVELMGLGDKPIPLADFPRSYPLKWRALRLQHARKNAGG